MRATTDNGHTKARTHTSIQTITQITLAESRLLHSRTHVLRETHLEEHFSARVAIETCHMGALVRHSGVSLLALAGEPPEARTAGPDRCGSTERRTEKTRRKWPGRPQNYRRLSTAGLRYEAVLNVPTQQRSAKFSDSGAYATKWR